MAKSLCHATPGGRHASAGGRQAGKSPHYRPILRPHAQRVLSPRKPPAPPAVPGTRLHPQTTPMPGPARIRTSTHTTRRAQHAPIPANRLNAVPSTRPHSKAVPSTRPYLNAHRTPCPARARIPRSSPLPRPSVRQRVLPETLDLKSTCYDATATEMLAAFVNCTLTAYPRASPPRRLVAPLPLPPLPPRDCSAWVRRFCIHRFLC